MKKSKTQKMSKNGVHSLIRPSKNNKKDSILSPDSNFKNNRLSDVIPSTEQKKSGPKCNKFLLIIN